MRSPRGSAILIPPNQPSSRRTGATIIRLPQSGEVPEKYLEPQEEQRAIFFMNLQFRVQRVLFNQEWAGRAFGGDPDSAGAVANQGDGRPARRIRRRPVEGLRPPRSDDGDEGRDEKGLKFHVP